MVTPTRRVVTGHDETGKSIFVSDGPPPQHSPMSRERTGADFHEIWSSPEAVPTLDSQVAREPNEREFKIMPETGHLLRIIDIYPLSQGGHRTPMHRTRTLDYMVVIEGEVACILTDSETVLKQGDVCVQRGTDHAWENRSDKVARLAYFHINGEFSDELRAKLPEELELMR